MIKWIDLNGGCFAWIWSWRLIDECIKSGTKWVRINENVAEQFNIEKGLRQDVPLVI